MAIIICCCFLRRKRIKEGNKERVKNAEDELSIAIDKTGKKTEIERGGSDTHTTGKKEKEKEHITYHIHTHKLLSKKHKR